MMLSCVIPLLLCSFVVSYSTSTSGCYKPLPASPVALKPDSNATFSLHNSNSSTPPADRQYHIYIPKNYDINTPAPLILSFHGRNQDMLQQERVSQLSSSDINSDSIVIYPNGYKNADGTREWSGDPDTPTSINDTTFVTELLDHVQERYCVDNSRVFATGKSNGGGLTNALACNPGISKRIAAFAPVSPAMYPAFEEPCQPGREHIPILEFHGGSDTTIRYEGGKDGSNRGVTVPIPTYLLHWSHRNGCTDPVVNKTVELKKNNGWNYANRTTWDCGGQEGIVTHYYEQYLGHKWPTLANANYSATEVILEFFRGFSLPSGPPAPSADKGGRADPALLIL
jgi:poly(3-hydroxybutyrate) depolymerase